jgi:thiol-disulfide isomerase/thioredoxin
MVFCKIVFAMCVVSSLAAVHAGLYSPQDAVVQHSAASFEEEVLGGSQFWVIEFFANWCGGCKMVAPWYKEAAKSLGPEGSKRTAPTFFRAPFDEGLRQLPLYFLVLA